jgi:uncharacterized protein (TIGR00369 family)
MPLMTLDEAQALFSSDGGHFAPWICDLGLRVEKCDATSVRLRLPYSTRIVRPGGVIIGQALMTVSDTIMVLAFAEALGRMASMATISITTNFLRAAVESDVIAEGRATKVGRSTLFGQIDLYQDGDARPVAQSMCTFAVLPDDNPKFQKVGTTHHG